MRQKKTIPAKVKYEIKEELRNVGRFLRSLRSPLYCAKLGLRGENRPQFYVIFDLHPRRNINGLRIQTGSVNLPDEEIAGKVYSCASSLYAIKERLKIWAKGKPASEAALDNLATNDANFRVIMDLADYKKHGAPGDRSGLHPTVGLIQFDTSQSGVIEFFYDGSSKDKELIVSNPNPVPFQIPLVSYVDEAPCGSAIDFLRSASNSVIQFIQINGVFQADDIEARRVLNDLSSMVS